MRLGEVQKVLNDARDKIEKALDQEGKYTHNILTLILRETARKVGYDEANLLIAEYDLKDLYGIFPASKE